MFRLQPCFNTLAVILLACAPLIAQVTPDSVAQKTAGGEGGFDVPNLLQTAFERMEDDPAVGGKVPDFAFHPLDNPGRTITNRSLSHSYYLISFWEPGHRSSYDHVKELEAIYRLWGGKLQIISFALGSSASEVKDFRKVISPMPWMHGVLSKSHGKHLRDDFNLYGIPAIFIIGRDGRVIAAGQKTREPFLSMTLKQLFQ